MLEIVPTQVDPSWTMSGTSPEVAAVVNFLCTEEDMYIHGQVIGINGGLAI